jgi:RNA polymerase sigma factor (sigma-70 family)
MNDPFADAYSGEDTDAELVARAIEGDGDSLERLIRRHQAWIYNIALRMVMLPEDAKDVTQEILMKVVTRLATFQTHRSFRTWLYRIVVNHVIDMKRTGRESRAVSFDDYAKIIERTPDGRVTEAMRATADLELIYEETKIECMSAMLLCLDRRRRIAFILGAVLGVGDRVGGEIMGISRANFRQLLSRSRRKLANFMSDRCGMIDRENPCHCDRKAGTLIETGIVDPANLQLTAAGARRVREVAVRSERRLDDLLERKVEGLFRDTPFMLPPDGVASLRAVFDGGEFDGLFEVR